MRRKSPKEKMLNVVLAEDYQDGEELECRRCRQMRDVKMFERIYREWRPGRLTEYGYSVLHPHCYECRKDQWDRIFDSPLYTEFAEKYFRQHYNVMKSAARARGLVCAMGYADSLELYLEQNGKCALTGLELSLRKNQVTSASVDRIDSQRHYTIDNIQIVCVKVNTMKLDVSNDEFLRFCKLVADYQQQRERELLDALA